MMLRCCLQGVLTQGERRGCCMGGGGTLHIHHLSYRETGGSGRVWTLTGLGPGPASVFGLLTVWVVRLAL